MKARITKRTIGAVLCYDDRKRKRWVVYRRAGGISRKTSVRYGATRTRQKAKMLAQDAAQSLRMQPAELMKGYRFTLP